AARGASGGREPRSTAPAFRAAGGLASGGLGVTAALGPAVEQLIALALDEDLGRGDATSEALVEESARARGEIVAKQALVVSGLDVAARVFARVDASTDLELRVQAGQALAPGDAL